MAKRQPPLWLRKTAVQVVAEWTARRAGTQWAESAEQRNRLVRWLCLELVLAIAERIPDARIAAELLRIHEDAITGLSARLCEDSPDA